MIELLGPGEKLWERGLQVGATSEINFMGKGCKEGVVDRDANVSDLNDDWAPDVWVWVNFLLGEL